MKYTPSRVNEVQAYIDENSIVTLGAISDEVHISTSDISLARGEVIECEFMDSAGNIFQIDLTSDELHTALYDCEFCGVDTDTEGKKAFVDSNINAWAGRE